jgi:hypothetical protein
MPFTRSGDAKPNWPGPSSQRLASSLGSRHERVLVAAAPRDKCQLRAPPRRPPQVGERGHRIVEEHHTHARHDDVEAARIEAVRLGIGLDERGVRRALGGCAGRGRRDQGRRNVDAGAAAGGPERTCHCQRRASGAASYVEHARPARRHRRVDEKRFERLEQPIEHVLQLYPGPTAEVVP